jgi:Domain of unknown function DUF29
MRRNAAIYEDDFYAWTQEQARLLRSGDLQAVDAGNVAEEIESMGRSDRRELKSRLTVLLTHLLKWTYQPEHRSTGWLSTIVEQRRQIAEVLADSPSLAKALDDALASAYADAREDAARETGLGLETFPATIPYATSAILDKAFMPNRGAQV